MRKRHYYIASDIHSHLTPLKEALAEAGWQKRHKTDVLVILGDIFDRGDETMAMYKFLRSFPKENLVLVRGNHEGLFLELLKKDLPGRHDYHNCTVKTFCQIAGVSPDTMDSTKVWWEYMESHPDCNYIEAQSHANKVLEERFSEIKRKVVESGIPEWLGSDAWQDYLEVGDYIMVHSFIPLRDKSPNKMSSDPDPQYFPTWRTDATREEWDQATWGCPYWSIDNGMLKEEPSKTLVCGHWHAYDFRQHYLNVRYHDYDLLYDNEVHKTYFGEGVIALDACTAISKMVNVLKIDA
jgi:hypothetical protein